MTTNPAPSSASGTEQLPSVVGLPDADLARAVAHPGGVETLAVRIAASGASVVAVGTDRFDPERGRGYRLDPTTAVLALGRALPHHGFLVAAAPTREHPYNVARRVLSLDHVLDGRVGLVVGAQDHGVPATTERRDPTEFADVIRGLWRTWPLDSIVGDRATGRFADTERIGALLHDGGPGGYRVRGPLTTPSSRQGEPVLAVWHDVALSDADLVLGGADHPLTPLATDHGVADPHDAWAADPDRTRRTLRDLLALRVPGASSPTPQRIGPAA